MVSNKIEYMVYPRGQCDWCRVTEPHRHDVHYVNGSLAPKSDAKPLSYENVEYMNSKDNDNPFSNWIWPDDD